VISISHIDTFAKLGIGNILKVAVYRAGVKYRFNSATRITADPAIGPFFTFSNKPRKDVTATTFWYQSSNHFSFHKFQLPTTPDWLSSPFQPNLKCNADRPWYDTEDLGPKLGDIKAIWEASRFDWAIAMAQRASLGNAEEMTRLNLWVEDWCKINRPYNGPNWKCGQEASVRVMHIATAAIVLDNVDNPTLGLRDFIRLHLQRIYPTIGYAIGQQNNHGTSEAAALYIGGSWLEKFGVPEATKWAKHGRQLLQNRAKVLIANDGSFSQHSLTYHRLMLDTYCISEVWRKKLDLPAFDVSTYEKIQAATLWLQQFVDPTTGDGPNLGANDGAKLIPLTETPYRDFRPTLQLASSLFFNKRAIQKAGPWDQALTWLDQTLPSEALPAPKSVTLDDGGYHILRSENAVAYLRYPRYKFRPGQCDALHLDLWVDGVNILRDGGSYSYNANSEITDYFLGNSGHNTAEFDGRNQMRRLSRFLWGDWLNAEDVHADLQRQCASASYVDYAGARHTRRIEMTSGILTCTDELSGKAKSAKIRWRLPPINWATEGLRTYSDALELRCSSPAIINSIELVAGSASLHYLEKTPCPVLEIQCDIPSNLTTEIRFQP
jgi:Heparinase II/III-like protein/Heparinase II/III N-terminus